MNNDVARAQCPSPSSLTAFILGKVTEKTQEECAAHIETCEACQTTLVELTHASDEFVEDIRKLSVAEEMRSESGFEPGLRRAREIAATDAPGSSGPQCDALPFAKLGNYRFVRLLGRGGMGDVYLVRNEMLGRNLALKLLHSERRLDSRAVHRFVREMRALGKSDHQHVVKCIDAGVQNGSLYLVMERVRGLTLRRVLSFWNPLPVADACEMVRQTALGLAHLHGKKLVHRDIKPSNLMLERSGVVKILDLGVALLSEPGDATLTHGGRLGTQDYMSPEQFEDSTRVDYRSDIYSLGCTFYELLTSQPPFRNTPNKGVAHAQQSPPPLTDLRDDVPPELASLLNRMLAKSPDDRPANCEALAAELVAWVADADLSRLVAKKSNEYTTSDVEGPAGVLRHKETQLQFPRAGKARLESTRKQEPQTAGSGWRSYGRIVLASLGAFIVLLGIVLVFRDKFTGRVLKSVEVPAAWDQISVSLESRRPSDASTFRGHNAGVYSLAISPDGKQIASGDGTGETLVWDVDDPKQLTSVPGPRSFVLAIAFSLDGQFLLAGDEAPDVTSTGLLNVWRRNNLQAQPISQHVHAGGIRAIKMTPNGTQFLTGGRDQICHLWDRESVKIVKTYRGHTEGVYDLAVIDDQRFASASYDRTVRVWDIATEQQLLAFEEHTAAVYCVAVLPDGQRAVSAGKDSVVRLWNLGTGEQEAAFEGHTEAIRDIAVTPDGKYVATASEDNTCRVWELATGETTFTFTRHTDDVRCIVALTDGRFISAAEDRDCHIWRPTP